MPTEFSVGRLNNEALGRRRNEKCRNLVDCSSRRHGDNTGNRRTRIRDKRLLAVDDPDPALSVNLRACPRRASIATGVRLGQAKCTERPPGDEVWQVLRLLLV